MHSRAHACSSSLDVLCVVCCFMFEFVFCLPCSVFWPCFCFVFFLVPLFLVLFMCCFFVVSCLFFVFCL